VKPDSVGLVRFQGAVIGSLLVGMIALAPPVPTMASEPPSRPYGDARLLARVPTPPGFPEGIAVDANRVYVAGPATFGTTGRPPPRVVAFNARTGKLEATFDTVGEDTLQEHADSSVAFDGQGRLYVLNTQLGMFRLSPRTGRQEAYGKPFPNLGPCVPGQASPCAPTPVDAPALPNDLAFDRAGNAYVTDSMQATIWKVRRGGGAPLIWFQDQRLASPYIGTNGLRLHPSGTRLFFTVTTDLAGAGTVYTLPLVARPSAGDLRVFHQYGADELPDGIAFGASGLLYVAIATPGNSGVSVLRPDGREAVRLSNPRASPVFPFDSPANIAFNGRGSILLTNHAFATGVVQPGRFAVIDVFVRDRGAPLVRPRLP
jgi:sugar lactone lactonase YvrE